MTAQQLANDIFNVSLVTMIITLVASLGLGLSVAQIVAPVKRIWLLLGTILVNTILAPFIAIGICHLFPLDSQARIGVEIVTIAAAGPAGLEACVLAKRADMAMGVSFTVVLQLLNIIAAPIWASQIITGATVNTWSIVGDMLLLVLAPLAIGLVLHARYKEHAPNWQAGLKKTSNIALVATIAVGLAVNFSKLVHALGTWVIVASIVIALLYAVAGWIVGLRHRVDSITISMISAFRFTPIGLIVIAKVLHNQGTYLTPALIFALVDTFVPFAFGAEIGRTVGRAAKPAETKPTVAADSRAHETPVPAAPVPS